jgi:hypothetical protein
MNTLETEQTYATTTELLDNAIEGLKSKLAKISVAAYQEGTKGNHSNAQSISDAGNLIMGALQTLDKVRKTL